MLITIISVILLVVGSIVAILMDKGILEDDKWLGSAIVLIVIGMFATLFSAVFTLINTCEKETDYQNKLYEKSVLEYRLENKEENTIGNELLYNDIVEFNNELRQTKKYSNSLWTNWFNNDKIATIDYIEIPGLT